MRFAMAIAALFALLMATRGALAQQPVTAGQLLANGFEVRASYSVERGTPVLVLQKGADVFLCLLIQDDALLKFDFAPIAKDVRAMAPLRTACAQIK